MNKLLLCTQNDFFYQLTTLILEKEGIGVVKISDAQQIKSNLALKNYLAVIIDFINPSQDQYNLWVELLNCTTTPIIVINTSGTSSEHLKAQQTATMLLTNPLIKVNKAYKNYPTVVNLYPGIVFDIEKHCVIKHNQTIELSTQEFKILFLLCNSENKILKSEKLIKDVYLTGRSSLYVHIKNLREKIENNPSDPEVILSKYGVGYYLKDYKECQQSGVNSHVV